MQLIFALTCAEVHVHVLLLLLEQSQRSCHTEADFLNVVELNVDFTTLVGGTHFAAVKNPFNRAGISNDS